jgi:hypothetical protein
MNKFFCVALLMLTHLVTSAQDYTVKGKIVYSDRTVTGIIKTQASEQTPQQFSFADSAGGKFFPVTGDVKRIEFENGNVYEPASVSIKIINAGYLQRTRASYQVPSVNRELYLQQVISGTYTLYLYNDPYGYHHFFFRHAGETSVTYLVNHPYVDENLKYVVDNSFNNQLSFLLQKNNCKSLEQDIRNLEYEIPSMRKFFLKLNGCVGSEGDDKYTAQSKTKIILSAAAGISIQKINSPGLNPNRWSQHPDPFLGASVFFSPGANKKAYGLGLDVLVSMIKREGDSIRFSYKPGAYHVRMATTTIFLRPYFRFDIGGEKLKPYLSFGFFNMGYNLAAKEEHTDQSGTTEKLHFYGSKFGVTIMPFVGAGLNYKRLSAEVSYDGLLLKPKFRTIQIIGRYAIFQ